MVIGASAVRVDEITNDQKHSTKFSKFHEAAQQKLQRRQTLKFYRRDSFPKTVIWAACSRQVCRVPRSAGQKQLFRQKVTDSAKKEFTVQFSIPEAQMPQKKANIISTGCLSYYRQSFGLCVALRRVNISFFHHLFCITFSSNFWQVPGRCHKAYRKSLTADVKFCPVTNLCIIIWRTPLLCQNYFTMKPEKCLKSLSSNKERHFIRHTFSGRSLACATGPSQTRPVSSQFLCAGSQKCHCAKNEISVKCTKTLR